MENSWNVILQLLFLLALLGISLILKTLIPALKKHLIPTALIGGFIGLLLGPEIANVIPFDSEILEPMVYHFMAVGFIALALKKRRKKQNTDIYNTGFAIVNTYIFQAFIGLGVSLLLVTLLFPDLFPNIGLMLPLSFAQGPGQALSIGTAWQKYGFTGGGNVGLSFATIGFLWALIGGIPYMNYLRRKHKLALEKLDPKEVDKLDPDIATKTAKVPKSIYIDDLTVQGILIGACYLLTYLILLGLEKLLAPMGTFGETLSTLFWGFQFLFGTLIAILMRTVMNKLRKKKIMKVDYVDNYLMQRISSTSFDLMITASIAAISLTVLKNYLWPVLIITTIGGIATMIYAARMSKWLYKEETVHNTVALYGMWTGTIVTGMALLKEIDPHGKSHVPENLVLGSGVGVIIGVPLMIILNIPINAHLQQKPILYVVTFIVFALYSAACLTAIWLIKRRAKMRKKSKSG